MAKKKTSKNELKKVILESVTSHIKDPVERQKAIESIETQIAKEAKQRAELLARAKPKEELVVAIDVIVDSIVSSAYNGRFTPDSEMVYGGRSPSYSTGTRLHSEISVVGNSVVKTLEFTGWPNIQRSDTIRAYIFKGKEEYATVFDKMSADLSAFSSSTDKPKSFYVERDFKEKESALKLEKLVGGVVVATYING